MLSRIGTIVAICFFLLAFHSETRADDEVTAGVVTVTGKIGLTNRGGFDPFTDAFFGYHEISFQNAYAFSREDLASLGMNEIALSYPTWPETPITFAGPSLSAVLDKVDAQGSTVIVRALDGYAVEFDIETVRSGRFILAIESNGRPLSIGGRGPAWLVFPQGSYAAQQDGTDEGLAWSVFHIAIE